MRINETGKCSGCKKNNVKLVYELVSIPGMETKLCEPCLGDFDRNTVKQHEKTRGNEDLVDKIGGLHGGLEDNDYNKRKL